MASQPKGADAPCLHKVPSVLSWEPLAMEKCWCDTCQRREVGKRHRWSRAGSQQEDGQAGMLEGMIEPPSDTGMSHFPSNALFPWHAEVQYRREREQSRRTKHLPATSCKKEEKLGRNGIFLVKFPWEENARGLRRCGERSTGTDGEKPKQGMLL